MSTEIVSSCRDCPVLTMGAEPHCGLDEQGRVPCAPQELPPEWCPLRHATVVLRLDGMASSRGAELIAEERRRQQVEPIGPCGRCDTTGDDPLEDLSDVPYDPPRTCRDCGGLGRRPWTAAHDDQHTNGELAWAAVCYAAPGRVYAKRDVAAGFRFLDPWPFADRWDRRPHDGNVLRTPTRDQRMRLLVKSGALIAAEIDRELRRGRVEP